MVNVSMDHVSVINYLKVLTVLKNCAPIIVTITENVRMECAYVHLLILEKAAIKQQFA
jgi:hypothetical protein